MAHEIIFDKTRGINPIAFVGEVPWHGLGQQLTPDSPLEVWASQAGMDWTIRKAPALYFDQDSQQVEAFPSRNVLYRSDDRQALSIVSDQYQIVQPLEVLEFYRDLVETAGFKLNTAGVLFGGKKFWALAEIGESARIQGQDLINGFLLLATSCDGSLATTAQFTSVRVVCNNTLTMAVYDGEKSRSAIKVPHNRVFDPQAVKGELGLAEKSFATFIDHCNVLAERKVSDKEAMTWLVKVFGKLQADQEITDEIIQESDAGTIQQVFTLFKGAGLGSNLKSADGTAWGLVNAVTEFTDHRRTTSTPDHRLNRAWFGDAAAVKNRAFDEALKLAA